MVIQCQTCGKILTSINGCWHEWTNDEVAELLQAIRYGIVQQGYCSDNCRSEREGYLNLWERMVAEDEKKEAERRLQTPPPASRSRWDE